MARKTNPDEVRSFARSGNRSLGRLARTDTNALTALVAVQAEVEELLAQAVAAQLADGASWADIARATGLSRPGAMHRWGGRAKSTRPRGAQVAALR